MIASFDRRDIPEAVQLWNSRRGDSDFPYASIGCDSFSRIFFDNPGVTPIGFKAVENEALEGFILGNIKKDYLNGENFDNTPFYLSMIITGSAYEGNCIASALLSEAEEYARKIGKKSIAITYRNLSAIPWIMHNNEGSFCHNNAPGVLKPSKAYSLFLKHGFAEKKVECGLYYPLTNYSMSVKALKNEERLNADGISIEFFDSQKHYGFSELFDALHGEVWRKTIDDNLSRPNPLPVLVASCGGRIIGFAGPVDKESSGRGWFNGIGVHPDYQRRGIARVLFSRLLEAFHTIGASFSTIFTDEGNPALDLYLDIGFRIGGKFSVMEKAL